jgi:hypothetical protein
MISGKTLVVALVGAGCIAAAGAGSYLAVRSASGPAAAEPAAISLTADEVQSAVQPAPASLSPSTSSEPAASASDTASRTTSAPTPHAAPVSPSHEAVPVVAAESRRAARRTARRAAGREAQAETVRRHPVPAAARAKTPAPAVQAPVPVSSNVLDPPSAVPDMRVAESADLPALSDGPTLPEPLDEVVIGRHSVIGIRLESPVSSASARVEDRIAGRVTRDVIVDGRVAIPSGSRVAGVVTTVEHGGRFRERARVGIRFSSVTVADDMHIPIETETIFREGDPPGGEATSKVGSGAVLGAIIGAVLGGKRGAAIGAGAGAAGGTAVVMASDANPATIPAGTTLTVRLSAPATVLIRHDPQ